MNKKLLIAIGAGTATAALALGLGLGLGLKHRHTFKEDWSSDAKNHWHEAACGHADEVSDKAEHTFENEVCTVCGYNAHVHTYSEDWTTSEAEHWHKATCAHTDEVSGKAVHTFENKVCTVCGYTVKDKNEVTLTEWQTALSYFNVNIEEDVTEGYTHPTINFSCTQSIVGEGDDFTVDFTSVLGIDYDKKALLLQYTEDGIPVDGGVWDRDDDTFISTGFGGHSNKETGGVDYFYTKEIVNKNEPYHGLEYGFDVNVFSYAGGAQIIEFGIYDGYELFTYSEQTNEYTATITVKDPKDNDMTVDLSLKFENGKLIKFTLENYYECTYTHTYEYGTTVTIPQFLLDLEVGKETPVTK